MTENSDRLERTLELLLYAPIGVGLFLKDTAPTFVNMFVSRGRAEVDRRQEDVQQRVTTARSLGQVALAFGPPVIRKHLEKTVADARQRVEGLLGGGAPEAPRPTTPEPVPWAPATNSEVRDSADDDPVSTASPTMSTNGDLTSSAALPIPGYDALSASQVVERLVGLAPEELDAVHSYEASHRQRRTILGKIEQLAG